VEELYEKKRALYNTFKVEWDEYRVHVQEEITKKKEGENSRANLAILRLSFMHSTPPSTFVFQPRGFSERRHWRRRRNFWRKRGRKSACSPSSLRRSPRPATSLPS